MANPSDTEQTPSQKAAHDADRAQRWQKISIDQLGYSVNLILTFTIALLGYWFALLRDEQFTPGPTAKCSFLFSLSALAIAVICGLSCVLIRVNDFRGTAERARRSPDAPSQGELRALGRRTRNLFTAHVIAFVVGSISLTVALLLTFGGKLR